MPGITTSVSSRSIALYSSDQLQRGVAAVRFEHIVAEPAQRLDHIGAHVGVVLHHQDAFAGAAAARLGLALVLGGGISPMKRRR